jgi:hypothetical protein
VPYGGVFFGLLQRRLKVLVSNIPLTHRCAPMPGWNSSGRNRKEATTIYLHQFQYLVIDVRR